jgi:hypothetical protein
MRIKIATGNVQQSSFENPCTVLWPLSYRLYAVSSVKSGGTRTRDLLVKSDNPNAPTHISVELL